MIRRKRKSPWISPQPETSNSDDGRWMQRITASQPDPEMVYAERETFEFINAVLGKMKPALRQALTMTYYDELSGPEACALLGLSAGTFKARLFRAKRQLLNQAQRALWLPFVGRPLLHSLPIEVLFSTLLQDPRIDRRWKPRIHDSAPAIPGDG